LILFLAAKNFKKSYVEFNLLTMIMV
jgi:hypothetical protein